MNIFIVHQEFWEGRDRAFSSKEKALDYMRSLLAEDKWENGDLELPWGHDEAGNQIYMSEVELEDEEYIDKVKEVAGHIYRLIIEANTLNDMGDTYIPEEAITNYLKEIL